MLELRALIEKVERERPPGLAAVAELMSRGAEMLAADRSFFDAAMHEAAGDATLTDAKLALVSALERLVSAAQRSGELRGDVTGVDVAMLMMAATNTCAPALAAEPALWRRYLALMIDGLRPGPVVTPLPVAALSSARMAALAREVR
jgi:2-keto-3-deoxy-galactonokinase